MSPQASVLTILHFGDVNQTALILKERLGQCGHREAARPSLWSLAARGEGTRPLWAPSGGRCGLVGGRPHGRGPSPDVTPLTGPFSYLPPPVQETRKRDPPSKAVGSGPVTWRGPRPPGCITGRERGCGWPRPRDPPPHPSASHPASSQVGVGGRLPVSLSLSLCLCLSVSSPHPWSSLD